MKMIDVVLLNCAHKSISRTGVNAGNLPKEKKVVIKASKFTHQIQ